MIHSAHEQCKEMRTHSDKGVVTSLDSQDGSSDFEVVGVGNESCCAEVGGHTDTFEDLSNTEEGLGISRRELVGACFDWSGAG